jgi:hypothetical protein
VASYRSTNGFHLARILQADGWEKQWERNNKVHLSKDGFRDLGFTLNIPLASKNVKAICKAADLPARRFEELYMVAAIGVEAV